MYDGMVLWQAIGEEGAMLTFCCGLNFAQYVAGKIAGTKRIREDIDFWHWLSWKLCAPCHVCRMMRESHKVEEVKQIQKKRPDHQKWRYGLFECYRRPDIALLTCVCCCIPMSRFYTKLGKDPLLYGLCGHSCLLYTRGRIAAAKDIHESFPDMCLAIVCCTPCAACQLFNEILD